MLINELNLFFIDKPYLSNTACNINITGNGLIINIPNRIRTNKMARRPDNLTFRLGTLTFPQ